MRKKFVPTTATTTGEAFNGTTTDNGSLGAMGIYYNHPLFLHSTDVTGIQIISFNLMEISLSGFDLDLWGYHCKVETNWD